MKKILLLMFAFIFIYANELTKSVDELILINHKIKESSSLLSEDAKDANNLKINAEIKEYENSKHQILSVFSVQINDNNLNNELFTQLKKSKENTVLKNAKLSFYESLNDIKNTFLKSNKEDNTSAIKSIIDNTLNKLKAIELKEENKIDVESLIEILTYLRVNTDIFQNNYIFQELDANKIISYINGFIPDNILKYLNIGKIAICILILILVFLFKNIFLKIIFFIVIKAFKREKNDVFLHFLESLTKPLFCIFYTYACWLCFLVSFYPAPILPAIIKIFAIINTILFTWLIIAVLNGYGVILLSKLAKKSGRKEVINLMMKIIYFIIVIIAILIILAKVGFDISAIVASLGIGGLAVALAAKDIIANFFASILMLFDNSFSQGDWIEVGSIEGTIVETGLRKTTIRTFDNCLVFIPNSTMLGGTIKNYSKRKYGRRVKLCVGVTYDASRAQLDKVVKDLHDMLLNSDLVSHSSDDVFYHKHKNYYKQDIISVNDLEGFKSSLYVWIDDFAASSINIQLYFYIKNIASIDYYQAKSQIMLEVMKIVEKNGLSFAFPSQSLYIEKMPEINLKN